jgi:hypothetical protein
MSHNEVLMDFGAVRQGSQKYQQLAQQLKQIYQALNGIADQLQTAAFLGAVGAEAFKMVTEVLKMLVQLRISKFQNLAQGMVQSIVARAAGDTTAVPNFTESSNIQL